MSKVRGVTKELGCQVHILRDAFASVERDAHFVCRPNMPMEIHTASPPDHSKLRVGVNPLDGPLIQ